MKLNSRSQSHPPPYSRHLTPLIFTHHTSLSGKDTDLSAHKATETNASKATEPTTFKSTKYRETGGQGVASLKSGAISTQNVSRDFTTAPLVANADPPPIVGDAAPLKVSLCLVGLTDLVITRCFSFES